MFESSCVSDLDIRIGPRACDNRISASLRLRYSCTKRTGYHSANSGTFSNEKRHPPLHSTWFILHSLRVVKAFGFRANSFFRLRDRMSLCLSGSQYATPPLLEKSSKLTPSASPRAQGTCRDDLTQQTVRRIRECLSELYS